MASEKQAADHVETYVDVQPGYTDLQTSTEAHAAIEKEHQMTAVEALRLYPKAVAWSLLLSCAIIMEGYDVVLIGSFFAFPAFNLKYGELMSDGKYGLAASWQASLTNAMSCGQIVGLFVNGIVSERYGYRKTLMACLATTIGFIFILFFAPNVQTLVAGELLMGIPLGVYQTLTVTYASEVCPVALRAYLPNHLRQSMLGIRAAHRLRRAKGSCRIHRPVGVPHPLRHPVGVASTNLHRGVPSTRESMVACTERQARRRHQVREAAHARRPQFQRRGNCLDDRVYECHGEACREWRLVYRLLQGD